MRLTTPRKELLLYHMSSPTKKMHVRANCEGRFTDRERIYSYSFVIPVKYIPEFLKTGLAKIRAHSTTWQLKAIKSVQRPIKKPISDAEQ